MDDNKLKDVGKVEISENGLRMGCVLIAGEIALQSLAQIIGPPTQVDESEVRAPYGHANNKVYLFDDYGIYATQEHSSELIDSINFVFDNKESIFALKRPFQEAIDVFGVPLTASSIEKDLVGFQEFLPGEYERQSDLVSVGVTATAGKNARGRRTGPKFIVEVNVCF